MGIWSSEARELLKVLCLQLRWKNDIINVINQYVGMLTASLEEARDPLGQDLGFGALSFMATCSPSYFPLEKSAQEWSFVV